MNSNKEIWKTIKEFPDYQVSNMGRVKSFKKHNGTSERILKPGIGEYGHKQVVLINNKKQKQIHVHVLVLEAFIGPRPLKHQGCHNDGNGSNNVLSNLRWDTVKGNHKDTIAHGTRNYGEKHPRSKLTEKDVIYILCHFKRKNKSVANYQELADKFNVKKITIKKIIYGCNWPHINRSKI